ncbi:unnamed protein product [Vicia faba]|uniref:Ureide permease n=1 Tax=Vicia faba TaxID=3906 RepID=A0AAV0YUV0_VICFA|nr:unnamed protein product [Vicia faba]
MYQVESKGGALVCMLLSLFFLGTWPAIMNLLERRGRLPQHTYLDYTITNLLAAVIIAFTFGQIGTHDPNFLSQLSQIHDNLPSVLFAMAGGVVLSIGNLSSQYVWAFVGLSVAGVITSSIIVVIGTILNYFLDDKINKAKILFPGVGCFFVAVCLGFIVHSSNIADNQAKLKDFASEVSSKDVENGSDPSNKIKAGTAIFLLELEKRRSIKASGKSTFIGLAITFFAGISFSLFSPLFNLATNDQYHTLRTESSLKAYLEDWNGRGLALLAGLLCGFGNGLQFMAGQAAGYAAADVVQCSVSYKNNCRC